MQDDNLQHMEYLLTKEAFDNWRNSLNYSYIDEILSEHGIDGLENIYLKEHGLPVGSVIKE